MAEEKQSESTPEQDAPSQSSNGVSIRLDQFLQGCGVPTGGQAKRMIQAGEILVNNEIETRRKKKLFVGDEVTLEDEIYVVATDDDADEATDDPA